MFRVLAYLIVNALVVLGLSWILPNLQVASFVAAMVFILILTVLHWTVLPVLRFFTFPLNVLTFGLVNGLLNLLGVGLAIWLVEGISLRGDSWTQLVTTLIIAVVLAVSSGFVEKALSRD